MELVVKNSNTSHGKVTLIKLGLTFNTTCSIKIREIDNSKIIIKNRINNFLSMFYFFLIKSFKAIYSAANTENIVRIIVKIGNFKDKNWSSFKPPNEPRMIINII